MTHSTDNRKYTYNSRMFLNILRIYLRKLVEKLPSTITGRHYLSSLIKYDRRAGTYINDYKMGETLETSPIYRSAYDGEVKDVKFKIVNEAHLKWLANTVIEGMLDNVNSVIEIGAGELTTIAPLKSYFTNPDIKIYASELAWSRLKVGRDFFTAKNLAPNSLSAASVLELPYRDNSFDCVLAHYFLEELSGYQEQAIKELLRISRKYVVMIEASYELGNKLQKRKLRTRRWNLEIMPAIKRNHWNLIEHKLVPYCHDIHHHGALFIIEKDHPVGQSHAAAPKNPGQVCCPICHGKLNKYGSFLKCEGCSLAFPVLDGIPVMTTGNAIVASKL